MNIDEEWEKFISTNYEDEDDDISINKDDDEFYEYENKQTINENNQTILMTAPNATDIYISTKTKIVYLNSPIDLKKIFWEIPIISYSMPINGVIKKQMKFNSLSIEDYNSIQLKLKNETQFEQHIITHIDNPKGRIKFKDTRKISIGMSKKDILSYRCKKKSAFYNCFVIILRLKIKDSFKEFHIKVFNTGKLEIPGIQNEELFNIVLDEVITILQPLVDVKLNYKETNEIVLINSNFNCGFYINRESLFEILKMKYNIHAVYDPCSYPGIQCKFYYNLDLDIHNQCGCSISEKNKDLYKNLVEVSFMIFRTGSVLIVGKCDENILYVIYEFLKNILKTEYPNIYQKHINHEQEIKEKTRKIRKKSIIIEFDN